MNIGIDNNRKPESQPSTGRTTTSQDIQIAAGRPRGAYALDISGTVMDNQVYEGQGKSVEDIMQEADLTDVALQRNYMTVMSNSVSDEDFAKLQEEGFHPGSTDIETIVTIVDQIKAALARGGNNVSGYTDDLDPEVLESITGSKGLAAQIIKQFNEKDVPATRENMKQVMAALEKANAVAEDGQLTEGAMKYMVANRLEPTIDNLYKAQHSASPDTGKQGKGYYRETNSGYYAKKAEEYNWEKLQPRMEEVIKESGITLDQASLTEAKWLVEKGIPLTADNIKGLHELRKTDLSGNQEKILDAVASTLSDGKNAGEANMQDARSYMQKAMDAKEDFTGVTVEAVDVVSASGNVVNLENLKIAQDGINNKSIQIPTQIDLTSRRMLEEIRLKMTIEAGMRLYKKGFSVETTELAALVEALKVEEHAKWKTLFGSDATDIDNKAIQYKETMEQVKTIPFLPAATIGRFAHLSNGDQNFTLQAVYDEGTQLQSVYEKAGESYEVLMTAPRPDMGDSIKKAFRNIDDILVQMNVECNEQNRKAVRILGYNKMEISEDNIWAVKKAELTVEQAVAAMTPKTVLDMIRDGVNPLEMSMEALNEYLESIKQADPDFDKYSQFLHKLDKGDAISPEERSAYIGTYRLLRQLEKSDDAAIGALLNAGVELSFKNLLMAVRSSKKQGMDYKIQDQEEIVDKIWKNENIQDQIEAGYEKIKEQPKENANTEKIEYFQKLGKEIYSHFNPTGLPTDFLQSNMSVEDVATMLRQQEQMARQKDSGLSQMREVLKSEEAIVKMLLSFDQPVTIDNLTAAGILMNARGKLTDRMKQLAQDTESEEEFEQAVASVEENMTDPKAAQDAYENLEQTYTLVLEKIMDGGDITKSIDVREMSNLHKQIHLATNLSKEENYEVPVNINGEYTSLNLRIVHDKKEGGRVNVTIETQNLGRATANLRLRRQEGYDISGYMASTTAEGTAYLGKRKENFQKELLALGIEVKDIPVMMSDEKNKNIFAQIGEKEGKQQGDITQISTQKLYQVAKAFIGAIQ